MEQKSQYNKTLQWIPLGQIHIEERYRVYTPGRNLGLAPSIERAGILEPFTVITPGKNILINGRERYDVGMEKLGPDYLVPVWLISDELTEEEIQWLILDLARVRHKSCVDQVNEFHMYHKLIPNNQGKTDVDQYRKDIIAGMIGISTSQLNKLLKIDRVKPALLHAVDTQVITIGKAETDCKMIELERKKQLGMLEGSEQDESQKQDQKIENKHQNWDIDLNALPTCCPCCNRPFSTLTWEDIPAIFNHKRKDDERQTNWIEPAA